MRIVHVTPYFVPEISAGVEIHVYELCQQLLSMGHQPVVYTCSRVPSEVDGIEVHTFSSFRPLPPIPNPFPYPRFFYQLSKEQDVIHAHGQEYVTSFIAALASKRGKVPFVLTAHNVGKSFQERWYVRILRPLLYRSLFGYTIMSADVVVAPTEEAFDMLSRFRQGGIVAIPHGISCLPTPEKQEDNYILYLGRLLPVKGPETLVRAIPQVLSQLNVKFIIAGGGPQLGFLKKLARELGVSDFVDFVGPVSRREGLELLRRASVFVAPGNAGYSLLEAACMGVPIVSANQKWNISCIGPNSAIYVETGDVREFAGAIVRVLTDKELARKLSKEAQDYVRAFRDVKKVAKTYLSIYEYLVRK
ncbi:MAG TPA: glycosyltransferase family 1 protein [Candidatus Korarchaeota archaeon]|nr:glycosyltransferase family 1 protein [Candidatus Korarchaeota archaeon]